MKYRIAKYKDVYYVQGLNKDGIWGDVGIMNGVIPHFHILEDARIWVNELSGGKYEPEVIEIK